MERRGNSDRMEANWNPNDSIEPLIIKINTGLLYATFAQFFISNRDTVNMGMCVITKTCLFKNAYMDWHCYTALQRAWFHFMTFIRAQCRINRLVSTTAGDFNYGGNATQQATEEEDTQFGRYIANISAAHSANQNNM